LVCLVVKPAVPFHHSLVFPLKIKLHFSHSSAL
jgi:hypothetical protein